MESTFRSNHRTKGIEGGRNGSRHQKKDILEREKLDLEEERVDDCHFENHKTQEQKVIILFTHPKPPKSTFFNQKVVEKLQPDKFTVQYDKKKPIL